MREIFFRSLGEIQDMYDVDLFVIGAGSGGVRAARAAAALGARVAIAEERYLGGTCVNVGCIPKKLYAYAAHYRHDFADSVGFGWEPGTPGFDWAGLRANKTQEIARLNGIYGGLLEQAGVTIYRGKATILEPHRVQIGAERTLSCRHLLIATGGWPWIPEFPGRELVLNSNDVFDLDPFPQRMLIVGGGYIALEFAGIFSGLGAEVTLSYRGDMPLRGFDADLRRHFFAEAGKQVRMLMETDIATVRRVSDGSLLVTLRDERELEVDAVLFATGRRPNTAGLGLERLGVRQSKDGSIEVNDKLESSVPGIHALGDVVGRMALTPVALAEGMFLANHLFGDGSRGLDYDNIATAVFCDPNLATVGLSESAALERYPAVRVFESEFRALRHTLSGRNARSYLKVVVDSASDRVLGMHMMGADAGEILQGFAAALHCGLTKAQLDATVGIHPTVAEEFVTLRTAAREVQGVQA